MADAEKLYGVKGLLVMKGGNKIPFKDGILYRAPSQMQGVAIPSQLRISIGIMGIPELVPGMVVGFVIPDTSMDIIFQAYLRDAVQNLNSQYPLFNYQFEAIGEVKYRERAIFKKTVYAEENPEVVEEVAAAPADPKEGQIWVDAKTSKPSVFDGEKWVDINDYKPKKVVQEGPIFGETGRKLEL